MTINRELGHGGSATRLFFYLIDCTSLRCFELRKLTFVKGNDVFDALERSFVKKKIAIHHLIFSVSSSKTKMRKIEKQNKKQRTTTTTTKDIEGKLK